jgi:ribosomal protein S18 acetylase RimI-like enzyme
VATETTFAYRPLSVDQVPAWAELYTAILVADADDDIMGEDDLAEEFADPLVDYPRGSIAVYDGGAMAGYCVVQPRSEANPVHEMRTSGGVHPDYRNLGIGSHLVEWSERAALELHNERFSDQPVALGFGSLAKNTSAGTLFADHGYLPSRWFHQMTRDLSAGIRPPVTPDGLEIVRFADERSADALLVRNESFRDHWAPSDMTPESWAFHLGLRAFRPEFSFIAYLNGEPAGLVMAHEYEAYNNAKGIRDLYIPQVATRRAGRRRGIASALLTTALTAARAAGFDTATLDVDADSPTGAFGLYERLGFVVRDTKIAHRKLLRT